MFKKAVGAGAGMMVAMSVAQAADIDSVSSHDWSGPYIGIQAGYGWGEATANTEVISDVVALSEPVILETQEKGSIDAEGILGGLHAGYNLQTGSFVFGIEADAELTDMDGDTDVFRDDERTELLATQEKEFDWLASLRLRAGYAMDRALIYATGGLTVGDVDMSFALLDGSFDESETETALGWTIGGGLEYAITDNLTIRAEYRYTDLENTSFRGLEEPEFTAEYDYENDFHAVRGGLSLYF